MYKGRPYNGRQTTGSRPHWGDRGCSGGNVETQCIASLPSPTNAITHPNTNVAIPNTNATIYIAYITAISISAIINARIATIRERIHSILDDTHIKIRRNRLDKTLFVSPKSLLV